MPRLRTAALALLLGLPTAVVGPALLGHATAQAAPAAVHNLSFDLTIGGKPVGKRDVSIRYFPVEEGKFEETRIIESYTEIDTTIAGAAVRVRNRTTSRADGSRISFTSSVDHNGTLTEVQGRRHSDGRWSLTVVEAGQQRFVDFRKSEADLCTLDLLDPKLYKKLTDKPQIKLLYAEAGATGTGSVDDLGEVTLQIGDAELPGTRVVWDTPGGRLDLIWNLEGVLVSYDAVFMGKKMSARLRQAPPPRAWGEVDLPLEFGRGAVIKESDIKR